MKPGYFPLFVNVNLPIQIDFETQAKESLPNGTHEIVATDPRSSWLVPVRLD